ncbi:tRNA adenosine(34) deaminase TadA [Shewanella sp. Isolate7]|uniref:tRNA adenosine(34) deaminase TadA n=1 Tax=Shewanella sp. Isolate7 TaxID=2908528 RepID=UPI001EFDD00F|nr:tRNA adenosine(34) deaminase TadA [Shewanella sp. Isolate7]MCG9720685.1 tRNA adenosine(34) deaminase TadA [Shewanella sp. Isolate7]
MSKAVEEQARLEQQAVKDEAYMRQAMALAAEAESRGEVPVGALLVKDDRVIATGFNLSICRHDASAHAEMECIRAAGQAVENYRLLDTTLYVTLEPCAMCAGAMVHARIARLVYGAADLKTGAAGSVVDLVRSSAFNHQLTVTSGVLAEECGEQLSAFFRRRRQEKKALKMAEKKQGQ